VIKLWQIWYTGTASERQKPLEFYPFETQEDKNEKGNG
jgi:hypothetical protein